MAVGCTKYRLYTGNQQLLAVAKLRHLHLYSSKERRLEYWSETEIERLTMSEGEKLLVVLVQSRECDYEALHVGYPSKLVAT